MRRLTWGGTLGGKHGPPRSCHTWDPAHPSGPSCRVRRVAESPAVQPQKGGCLERWHALTAAPQALVEIGAARALPRVRRATRHPADPGCRAVALPRGGRFRHAGADVIAREVAGEVRLVRDGAGEVGADDAVVHAARRLVVHRRVFDVERLLDACMGRVATHDGPPHMCCRRAALSCTCVVGRPSVAVSHAISGARVHRPAYHGRTHVRRHETSISWPPY